MAKIKIERAEYERLLAVERAYHALRREIQPANPQQAQQEQTAPSLPAQSAAVDNLQAAEQAPVSAAAAESAESDKSAGNDLAAQIRQQLTLRQERQYSQADVFPLLAELSRLCKISGAVDAPGQHNTALFLDQPGARPTVQFRANHVRLNMDIKNEAKDILWRETSDCLRLNRLREQQYDCTGNWEQAVANLAEQVRSRGASPLLAIVHGQSQSESAIFLFWLAPEAGLETAESAQGGENCSSD